jgi:hypothetical protein
VRHACVISVCAHAHVLEVLMVCVVVVGADKAGVELMLAMTS